MTQAISVRSMRPAESRLIAGVCAAHLMSHYYMLMLAPLLAYIRDDFNVTYTQLALALTVFNVVSAVLQTPVGFVVDRVDARMVLIVGLALSSLAYAVAGLANSFGFLSRCTASPASATRFITRRIIRCCPSTRRLTA